MALVDATTDYYTSDDRRYRMPRYTPKQSKTRLMEDFPWIYASDIGAILYFLGYRYAKTHRALSKIMEELDKVDPFPEIQSTLKAPPKNVKMEITNNDRNAKKTVLVHRMKQKRELYCAPESKIQSDLLKEIKFVRESLAKTSEQTEGSLAFPGDVKVDSLIECACCFGDAAFEKTAQCCEGHLVCIDCLTKYTNEKVFGCGKLDLDCMASDCSSSYPTSELVRCLPANIRAKWEECLLESSLKKANIDNLTRCPYCNYAAIVAPTSLMFFCQREDCQKLTCKQCGVDWYGHEGKSCSEMEQRDEMALRKKFEENMTKSKVRVCRSCGTEFLKESGCNRMTCRCGATMCYVCRKPKIAYAHFCRHPRDPGHPCRKCRSCSLWSTTEDDEELAISELQRQAQEKRKGMGFADDKLIGVPCDKKPRLDPRQAFDSIALNLDLDLHV